MPRRLGLLLGLDTLVSTAYGAGRLGDCHRSLLQGVYLCCVLAPPMMLVMRAASQLLAPWGIESGVVDAAIPYVSAAVGEESTGIERTATALTSACDTDASKLRSRTPSATVISWGPEEYAEKRPTSAKRSRSSMITAPSASTSKSRWPGPCLTGSQARMLTS